MRKLLLLISALLLLSVLSVEAQNLTPGGNSYGTVISTRVSYNPKDEKEPEEPPINNRKPMQMREAMIAVGMVMIEGVDMSEICSYEISSLEGIYEETFFSVSEFTHSLFSLSGEVEIRFVTAGGAYIGYVYLE